VQVYPYSNTLEEFGGQASLDKFGCVLVSGDNRFPHNRFVDRTCNGFQFPRR